MKYTPFASFLKSLPPSTADITLSFIKIAEILKSNLPPSAFKYQASWAYEVHPRHPQKVAWQSGGWKVTDVDFPRQLVRFQRFK